MNKHFKLGLEAPVIERDFEPLGHGQLTVWNAEHPAPKAADPDFERSLLKWLTDDANKQLSEAATTPEGVEQILSPGVETVIGRPYAGAGTIEWELGEKQDRSESIEMSGRLLNRTYNEELDVLWLYPKNWNGRVVVWLGDTGKGALQNDEVSQLVAGGTAVIGADLLFQGGEAVTQTRVVENPREFAGYTHGYNHALFAQRVHDVMTIVTFLRNTKVGTHQSPDHVSVVARGHTGPITLAARALAGSAIDRAAVETGGFRFGNVLDYRDPSFLPGGAKYLDLPGLIILNGDLPLRVEGEGEIPVTGLLEWLGE